MGTVMGGPAVRPLPLPRLLLLILLAWAIGAASGGRLQQMPKLPKQRSTEQEPDTPPCSLDVDTGECTSHLHESHLEQWAWNRFSGECEIFIFKGCGGGNNNRFNTEKSCHKACEGTPIVQPPPGAVGKLLGDAVWNSHQKALGKQPQPLTHRGAAEDKPSRGSHQNPREQGVQVTGRAAPRPPAPPPVPKAQHREMIFVFNGSKKATAIEVPDSEPQKEEEEEEEKHSTGSSPPRDGRAIGPDGDSADAGGKAPTAAAKGSVLQLAGDVDEASAVSVGGSVSDQGGPDDLLVLPSSLTKPEEQIATGQDYDSNGPEGTPGANDAGSAELPACQRRPGGLSRQEKAKHKASRPSWRAEEGSWHTDAWKQAHGLLDWWTYKSTGAPTPVPAPGCQEDTAEIADELHDDSDSLQQQEEEEEEEETEPPREFELFTLNLTSQFANARPDEIFTLQPAKADPSDPFQLATKKFSVKLSPPGTMVGIPSASHTETVGVPAASRGAQFSVKLAENSQARQVRTASPPPAKHPKAPLLVVDLRPSAPAVPPPHLQSEVDFVTLPPPGHAQGLSHLHLRANVREGRGNTNSDTSGPAEIHMTAQLPAPESALFGLHTDSSDSGQARKPTDHKPQRESVRPHTSAPPWVLEGPGSNSNISSGPAEIYTTPQSQAPEPALFGMHTDSSDSSRTSPPPNAEPRTSSRSHPTVPLAHRKHMDSYDTLLGEFDAILHVGPMPDHAVIGDWEVLPTSVRKTRTLRGTDLSPRHDLASPTDRLGVSWRKVEPHAPAGGMGPVPSFEEDWAPLPPVVGQEAGLSEAASQPKAVRAEDMGGAWGLSYAGREEQDPLAEEVQLVHRAVVPLPERVFFPPPRPPPPPPSPPLPPPSPPPPVPPVPAASPPPPPPSPQALKFEWGLEEWRGLEAPPSPPPPPPDKPLAPPKPPAPPRPQRKPRKKSKANKVRVVSQKLSNEAEIQEEDASPRPAPSPPPPYHPAPPGIRYDFVQRGELLVMRKLDAHEYDWWHSQQHEHQKLETAASHFDELMHGKSFHHLISGHLHGRKKRHRS